VPALLIGQSAFFNADVKGSRAKWEHSKQRVLKQCQLFGCCSTYPPPELHPDFSSFFSSSVGDGPAFVGIFDDPLIGEQLLGAGALG